MNAADAPAVAPGWAVSFTTVVETRVRVASRRRGDGGPWPLSGVLAELSGLGVRPADRFRALGSGRGAPLVHTQQAAWRGLPVELEAVVDRGLDVPAELSLGLPSHAEIAAAGGPGEAAFWELVDAFAASGEAGHGAILDGEAMALDMPQDAGGWQRAFSRHFCLLVPERVGRWWAPAARPYRRLPRSGLAVVLR